MGRANLEGLGSSNFIAKSHFGGSRELKSSLASNAQMLSSTSVTSRVHPYAAAALAYIPGKIIVAGLEFKKTHGKQTSVARSWSAQITKIAKTGPKKNHLIQKTNIRRQKMGVVTAAHTCVTLCVSAPPPPPRDETTHGMIYKSH